jgi:DNA-binding LacI/PurR family transcriptional regulator
MRMDKDGRRPTQSDVAKLAGVARSTVSVVLSDSARSRVPISGETREKVLAAARELGYVANPAAQMLAGGRTNTLGVFCYDTVFPLEREEFLYPHLLGIEREAGRQGYNLLLFTRHQTTGHRSIYPDGINILKQADGALLMGWAPGDDEIRRLAEEGFPFLYIGRREVRGLDIDWVVSDRIQAGEDAARHLLDLGHLRLGYLDIGYSWQTGRADRIEGIEIALKKTGSGAELIILGQDALEHGTRLTEELERHRITALLGRDIWHLYRVLLLLEKTPIRVPKDLSLVALAQDERGEWRWPHLRPTHTLHHRDAIGKTAVRALLARLEGQRERPQHIRVPCELVVGNTTGPARP